MTTVEFTLDELQVLAEAVGQLLACARAPLTYPAHALRETDRMALRAKVALLEGMIPKVQTAMNRALHGEWSADEILRREG